MYKSTGFISFILRRLTGVVLSVYLLIHIWVIGAANQGEAAFNERMENFQSPLTIILEIGLLAAVIYHAFDGIRILIIDWFGITEYRKSMFYAAFATATLLTIVGGIPMLLFAIDIA